MIDPLQKKTYLQYILTFFYISVYCLVCTEILFRVIAWNVSIYDVEMLKYAVKLKQKSSHPLLSHEHIPNSEAELMGVKVKLNSLGHRNNDLPLIKKEGDKRIHIIGSSMTLGWGVPQELTYASQLEKKINQVSSASDRVYVINAGVGNTNTVQYVELFKLQLTITDPDIVIMQYFINDAEVISKKNNNPILKNIYSLAYLKQAFATICFRLFNDGSLADYYKKLYQDDSVGWQAVKTYVKTLQDIALENDMKFIILFIPDLHDFSEKNPLSSIYFKVISTFQHNGITVINTYPSLKKRFEDNPRNAWVAQDDAHPNALAHEIIADDLLKYFLIQ